MTGSTLIKQLAQRAPHAEIRAVTRNPASRNAKWLQQIAPNVRLVQLDLLKSQLNVEVLHGVTRVYALPPFLPKLMVEWHQRLSELLQTYANVNYLVKHSVIGARELVNEDTPSSIPTMHGTGEQLLDVSQWHFTSLRPTIFAQHFISNKAIFKPTESEFFLPIGEAKVAFIDARNIGEVAAKLLASPNPKRHADKAYTLTGPVGVTLDDIRVALSNATRQEVNPKPISDEAFVQRLHDNGLSPALIAVYQEAREGWFSEPSPDFYNLMGYRANTFFEFAQLSAPYFLGGNVSID